MRRKKYVSEYALLHYQIISYHSAQRRSGPTSLSRSVSTWLNAIRRYGKKFRCCGEIIDCGDVMIVFRLFITRLVVTANILTIFGSYNIFRIYLSLNRMMLLWCNSKFVLRIEMPNDLFTVFSCVCQKILALNKLLVCLKNRTPMLAMALLCTTRKAVETYWHIEMSRCRGILLVLMCDSLSLILVCA